MNTYQFEHPDGRITDLVFAAADKAQAFLAHLNEAGPGGWQLHTPICDALAPAALPQAAPPVAAPGPLAHPKPFAAMQEVALWVEVALQDLLASGHPGLKRATEALRVALSRLDGSCPARLPLPGLTGTQEPTVPYGQPNARGQNEAAADNGFAS